MIELLESRIAPATLIGSSAFTYTDVDGDSVKVSFSKPILNAANFDSIVNITGGKDGTGPQDLIGLDLFNLSTTFNGLNVTIVATPTRNLGGDGRVSGVYIDAFNFDEVENEVIGIDLGVVKVDGDLSHIDAGDGDWESFALKSLTVASMGMAEPGKLSDIYGPVGTVTVNGDYAGYIYAESPNLVAPDFKTITIKGSVLGNLGEDAGRIFAFAGITTLKVGGDVIGGAFDETGSIRSAGPIDRITIKGSIIGGDALGTGRLRALEYAKIQVNGSLVGGFGSDSGVIETFYGDIISLTINGSILGGRGDGAGSVRAGDSYLSPMDGEDGDDGTIRTMVVKGSVIGLLPDSEKGAMGLTIRADNSIGKLTIYGSLMNANIVAGVAPGADLVYGTSDDTQTEEFLDAPRKIASIVVKNGVYATEDVFTITAVDFGSIQAGGPILKPGGALANFDSGFILGNGDGIFVVKL